MSVSRSKDKIQLEVKTKDQTADIYVIDSSFRVAGRGHGTAQTFDLKPGIYTVKVNVGSESREKNLVLMDKPETAKFDAIEFSSAIPLNETAITHEYHIWAAEQESQKIHIKKGKGSWIFIFARDWKGKSDSEKQFETTSFPHKGLKLKGKKDEVIVDLETDEKVACNLSQDAWAACNIEVDPGQYRLSVKIEADKSIQQTIVACRGWQTQVFLLQRNYGSNKTMDARRADLTNTGILMARGKHDRQKPGRLKDKMFDAQNPKMRLLDLARLGLTKNRQILPEQVVDEILHGKFDNPMLGILGAYILLGGKKTPLKLLHKVIGNLRRILGEGTHPDVEALALRIKHKSAKYNFDLPPMLRQSWIQVVKSTAQNPDLIPSDSFACQNSDQMLGDEPWLLYRSESPGTIESVNDAILHLVGAQTAGEPSSSLESVQLPRRFPISGGQGPPEESDSVSGAEMSDDYYEKMAVSGAEMSDDFPEEIAASEAYEAETASIPTELDNKKINDLVSSMGLPKAKIIQILRRLDL